MSERFREGHYGANVMLTPRQQDLVKRFFVGISLLDEAGERNNAQKAKWILQKSVKTDIIKLDDIQECDPEQEERQHYVFHKLSEYNNFENLSKRLSYVIAICAFAFSVYQFFESGWMWGLGTLALVPIGALVSYLIFLAVFTSGFSPLALGLTHTECRFACDEIVGHSRWNE
jgi:hypothetical protein